MVNNREELNEVEKIPLSNGDDRNLSPSDISSQTDRTESSVPLISSKPSISSKQASTSFDETDSNNKKHRLSESDVVKKRRRKSFDVEGKSRFRAEKFENRLKERTGLSRKGLIVAGIILLLLFIALLVIIVLGATWPRIPHHKQFPICTKAACILASSVVLPKMNVTAPPCNDFVDFACGAWIRSNPVPPSRSKWSSVQQRAFKYREELRWLINTLSPQVSTHRLSWKLKYFYESCMAPNIATSDARPLKKLIDELGNWHVLRDFDVLTWDPEDVLVKLHSKYGVHPFFKVSVVPDSLNPQSNIVQVAPAGLGLPDRSYYYRTPGNPAVEAYKHYVKDTMQSLGATTTEAGSSSEGLFYFEKRVAEMTPGSEELRDPVAGYNRRSLAAIAAMAPSVPLQEILRQMYPGAHIDDNTEVVMTSATYLTKVSSIIASADREVLNNYMIWTLVSAYLPYLSKKYTDITDYYQKELTGTAVPVERWEMCIATMQRHMSFALAAMHQKTQHGSQLNASKPAINKMFEAIQESVKASIRKASWFEPELKRHALEKINSLGLQVGFPSTLTSEAYLEEHHAKLSVQKNDLFQSILYAVTFHLQLERARLVNASEEHRWMDEMADSDEVFYVRTANKVVVPHRLLETPFYHPQYPLAVQFGGLGMQLASAVLSAVLPPGSLHSSDGRLLAADDSLVNQTVRAVRWPLRHMAEEVARRGGATQRTANRTAASSALLVSAVRHARTALTELLSHLPHTHQPAMMEFEDEAIFYTAFAQDRCLVSRPQQADLDNVLSWRLPGRKLIVTTLRQLPEFKAFFSCPSGSAFATSQFCDEIL